MPVGWSEVPDRSRFHQDARTDPSQGSASCRAFGRATVGGVEFAGADEFDSECRGAHAVSVA